MDTNKILKANLLDIVFEGRNKDYGAYELRVTYPERIKKSLIIIITFAALVFAGSVLGNKLNPSRSDRYLSREVTIEELKPDEKKPEVQPEIKKPEVQPQTKTIQFTAPLITDEDVDKPLPEDNEIDNSKIDTKTIDGLDDSGYVDDKPIVDKGIIDVKPTEDPGPLTVVEIPAKFNGWENFLRKHLNGQVAVDNDAPPGMYRVIIQFVVDKEGNVTEIKPLTNVGFGMEEEAVRVIRKATKWEPAIQNGYKAKAFHKQPITFVVGEE